MKKVLILIAAVSILAACGVKDPIKSKAPKPGAEVVFAVTNIKENISPQQTPFHLLGNLELDADADLTRDYRIYTGSFIPEEKEGLIGIFQPDGNIMGALGEYPETGDGRGIVVIGDWMTVDHNQNPEVSEGKKHLFIQLYEDELDFLANSYDLLWPNEPR